MQQTDGHKEMLYRYHPVYSCAILMHDKNWKKTSTALYWMQLSSVLPSSNSRSECGTPTAIQAGMSVSGSNWLANSFNLTETSFNIPQEQFKHDRVRPFKDHAKNQ